MNIIFAPYGDGGHEKGAEKGVLSLYESLKDGDSCCHMIDYEGELKDNKTKTKILSAYDFCNRLSKKITEISGKTIVIGGDHSIAIGSWSGVVKKLKNTKEDFKMGVLWIDAHMDSHTPSTSPTNNVHGYPLASLMGYGDSRLCNLEGIEYKIDPKNVVLIGSRSYERGEKKLLKKLGVRFITAKEFKQDEDKTIKEAMSILTEGTDGFGVSLDVDVMEPNEFPGIGLPEKGGFNKEQLFKILSAIYDNKDKVEALELVENFPEKDIDNKMHNLCLEIIDFYKKILK